VNEYIRVTVDKSELLAAVRRMLCRRKFPPLSVNREIDGAIGRLPEASLERRPMGRSFVSICLMAVVAGCAAPTIQMDCEAPDLKNALWMNSRTCVQECCRKSFGRHFQTDKGNRAL